MNSTRSKSIARSCRHWLALLAAGLLLMQLQAARASDIRLVELDGAIGPATAILAFGLENLFNAAYTIVRFYPMPPRQARLGLTLDLHP